MGDDVKVIVRCADAVVWPVRVPSFKVLKAPRKCTTCMKARKKRTNCSATSLILLLILHVGAALKHHFWNRDDVLRRMASLCTIGDTESENCHVACHSRRATW